jgi:hypothetical protein
MEDRPNAARRAARAAACRRERDAEPESAKGIEDILVRFSSPRDEFYAPRLLTASLDACADCCEECSGGAHYRENGGWILRRVDATFLRMKRKSNREQESECHKPKS